MLEVVPTKVEKDSFLLTRPEGRFGKPKSAGRAGFNLHTPIRVRYEDYHKKHA